MKPRRLLEILVPTLLEDERLLVVSKPAGVDVGGRSDKNLDEGLVEILGRIRGGDVLHPVNRLSRFESGVLLFAKTKEAWQSLRAAWRAGRVQQDYVAVVIGRAGRTRLAIGDRDDAPGGRRAARTKPPRPSARPAARSTGKPDATPSPGAARTSVQLLAQGEKRSLVRCRTNAPTTHALRAQLRAVHLRLWGDRVHDAPWTRATHEDTCLHLSRMEFRDPTSKAFVSLRCNPPDDFSSALDGRPSIIRAAHAALVRRLDLLTDGQLDSCRLITGSGEGISGVTVEKYADVGIVQMHREETDEPALRRLCRWYADHLHVAAFYLKRFVKDRAAADSRLDDLHRSPRPFLGRPVPAQIEIRENNLRFAVRPFDGFSVGLFLDQRDNRRRVAEASAGKDVLNLFAYTCGFSVAAAVGGAKSTTSVDISPRHLDWGRTNFELNRIDLTDHQFFRADAFEFLQRARRKEWTYDLIVLDPPSFAHGRKSGDKFSVISDLPRIVADASAALRPDGRMLISSNYRKMPKSGLRQLVKQGAAGRKFKIVDQPRLPIDFAADPDHAKSLWVQFE